MSWNLFQPLIAEEELGWFQCFLRVKDFAKFSSGLWPNTKFPQTVSFRFRLEVANQVANHVANQVANHVANQVANHVASQVTNPTYFPTLHSVGPDSKQTNLNCKTSDADSDKKYN